MYDKLIKDLLEHSAVRATHFINPKEIVRAVRTKFNGKFVRGNLELTLTKGKPNYAERELVKKFKGKINGFTFFKYLPKKKGK
jgi:hypothetical protein